MFILGKWFPIFTRQTVVDFRRRALKMFLGFALRHSIE